MKITMFNQDLFKYTLEELYTLKKNTFDKILSITGNDSEEVMYLTDIDDEISYREAKSLSNEKLDLIGINITSTQFTEKQKNDILLAVNKLITKDDRVIPYYKFLFCLIQEIDQLKHIEINDQYISSEYMKRFTWYSSGILRFMEDIVKAIIKV